MNLKLKKILPIVIVAVLLLLAALGIYAILVGPSKEPYRAALTQYRNVYNANVAFTKSGAALNASGATDAQFTANVKNVNTAMKSIQIENEALGKQTVLTNGEGKQLYDTFNQKLAKYLEYNTNVINSIEAIRPVLYICTQDMNNITETAASAQQVRTCATDMEKVNAVPDADYKQMVVSFQSAYGEIADNIEKTAALPDPKGADKSQYDALVANREELLKSLNEVSATLTKNLQSHRAEVDITDSAIALDKYLSAKSSIF